MSKSATKDLEKKACKVKAEDNDDSGYTTPPPIKYDTPVTSPSKMNDDNAGCHSIVYACYDNESNIEDSGDNSEKGNEKSEATECTTVNGSDDNLSKKKYPPVGSVIALHGHHFDAHRWPNKERRVDFYGVVREWDTEQFGVERDEWVQVQVITNGDYVINPFEGHNNLTSSSTS